MKYKILVLGDTHITEDDDLERFRALAVWSKQFTIQRMIWLGDAGDWGFMSKFKKDKASIDFNTCRKNQFSKLKEAIDILLDLAKETDLLEGNHCYSYTDYLKSLKIDFSEEAGIAEKLELARLGWNWVPYKQQLMVNGVSFVHAPINGNGKPLAGDNIAHKALAIYSTSVVFGHYHREDMANKTRHNAPMIKALCVGCYIGKDPEYRDGAVDSHWKGIYILNMDTDKPGTFTHSTYTMEEIMEYYANHLAKEAKKAPKAEAQVIINEDKVLVANAKKAITKPSKFLTALEKDIQNNKKPSLKRSEFC